MPGFDHHSPAPTQDEPEPTSTRSTYYGRVLFVCYALLYAGFVFLNAFHPEIMKATPFGDINLAVLYGLALIAAAFLLALFYDWLCRVLTNSPKQNNEVGP